MSMIDRVAWCMGFVVIAILGIYLLFLALRVSVATIDNNPVPTTPSNTYFWECRAEQRISNGLFFPDWVGRAEDIALCGEKP